jgi:hypothetical protein
MGIKEVFFVMKQTAMMDDPSPRETIPVTRSAV